MTEALTYLPGILLIFGVFLLQNATPGPNVLAVAGSSMALGRRAGLAVSVGVACGTLTWSTTSVLGLAAFIATYGQLLVVIKILGGLYLCYLGYKAFRAAFSKIDTDFIPATERNKSVWGLFMQGYLLNLTNPKAAFGWIAIVSLGMDAASPGWVMAAIIFGTTTLSILVHVTYTFVFSTPTIVAAYLRARRPVHAALGGLFAFAGYRLLTTKLP